MSIRIILKISAMDEWQLYDGSSNLSLKFRKLNAKQLRVISNCDQVQYSPYS
jgi:hypothetical protein